MAKIVVDVEVRPTIYPTASYRDAIERLEVLGNKGFTISICYGPSKGFQGGIYSVLVNNPKGEEFEKPYRGGSLVHCIEIAEKEIVKRGW